MRAEALGLAFGEAGHPVSGERSGRPGGCRRGDGFRCDVFGAEVGVGAVRVGGLAVRAAVRAAHVAAVEDAGLAYLEDHAALTRRGHDGVMVCDTEGLVIARFEHRASRAGDPQLHSHCLVLNKVRDPGDGSWRALDGRALYQEAKAGRGHLSGGVARPS